MTEPGIHSGRRSPSISISDTQPSESRHQPIIQATEPKSVRQSNKAAGGQAASDQETAKKQSPDARKRREEPMRVGRQGFPRGRTQDQNPRIGSAEGRSERSNQVMQSIYLHQTLEHKLRRFEVSLRRGGTESVSCSNSPSSLPPPPLLFSLSSRNLYLYLLRLCDIFWLLFLFYWEFSWGRFCFLCVEGNRGRERRRLLSVFCSIREEMDVKL